MNSRLDKKPGIVGIMDSSVPFYVSEILFSCVLRDFYAWLCCWLLPVLAGLLWQVQLARGYEAR